MSTDDRDDDPVADQPADAELADQQVDALFAEMMASYHLTAGGHDGPAATTPPEAPSRPEPAAPSEPEPISWLPRGTGDWLDDHPLFTRPEPVEPDPEDTFERYVPEPQPPMRWPRWPVLLGWACMVWALVAAILVIFGLRLPTWAGWLAVLGFLGGFGLLISQLPRHRPPDSGDGAVL